MTTPNWQAQVYLAQTESEIVRVVEKMQRTKKKSEKLLAEYAETVVELDQLEYRLKVLSGEHKRVSLVV